MHKFELGGTGQVVPAALTPMNPAHLMVWEYLGDNTYSSAFKFFRYNLSGELQGSMVLTNEVWVSEDGMEYGGYGIAEQFDLNGDPTGVPLCPVFSGTRFTAAP